MAHIIMYKKKAYPNGVGGGGDYFFPIIYSTEEREVGVWTDNKPLYEMVVDFGVTVQLRTSGTNITSYLPSDIEMITDAVLFNTEYSYEYHVLLQHYNNQVIAYPDQNVEGRFMYIQYTKTTDTAGSGKYNTLGVPTVHYTINEQVIGTWIDGRTIYRRVFDFSNNPINIPSNTWLKIDNLWAIQPINSKAIFYGSRNCMDVAVDCDDNDGMYVKGYMDYSGCNAVVVEYVKDSD